MPSNTSGYDQSNTRHPGTLTDQHGRKWFASIDNKSGFPVGIMQPKGWSAPWIPNQGFFVFGEDPEEIRKFRIDYKACLDQRLEAHERWAQDFRQTALVRGWNPEDPEKSQNITELVGKKPQPVEVVIACMQGNKWMLGFTDKVDPRLEPFIKKRTDKIARIVESMDFTDKDETDAEKYADFEEEIDPEALGGRKIAPRKKNKPVANAA